MLKQYYQLTKPGIIYGNIINATAGLLLASKGHVRFGLLLATLSGTSLIIGASCVFNNYIDREIDKKMQRTKGRALANGLISTPAAMIYATTLGLLGFLIIGRYTNRLVFLIGAVAAIFYIAIYGYAKRHSVYGTLVGAVAGAAPPVAGYVAVTNHFDSASLVLFIALVAWQMPHFYAIAIRRLKDYRAAGIPVWPAVRGVSATKIQIVMYILAFGITSIMLSVLGYTGVIYAIVMAGLSLYWASLALQGLKTNDNEAWAKKLFLFSLVVTLGFSIMISVGGLLP